MDLLVVDDESSILSLCRRGINPDEITVHTASSGKEALEILGNKKIDILLTDLVMEPVNGLTLTKQVRKQYPDVDILIMTGFPTIDSVVNGLKLGAYDYIIKPLDLVLLKTAIRRCAERRQMKSLLKTLTGSVDDAKKRIDELTRQLEKLQPGLPPGTFEVEHAAARGMADLVGKELYKALKATVEQAPLAFPPVAQPKPAAKP